MRRTLTAFFLGCMLAAATAGGISLAPYFTLGSTLVSLGQTVTSISGLTLPSPTFSGTVAGNGTIPNGVLATDPTNATNLSSGTVPTARLGNVGIPNFKVTLTGGNQSVTSGTITKVAFDTVVIDSGSFWSTSNKNYLPTVSGTYAFCAQVAGQASFTVGNDLAMFISKNGISGGAGTALTSYQSTPPTTVGVVAQAMHDCTITSMNGSSDTIEVDAAVTGTSPAFTSNSSPQTYLIGWRIGP